MDAHYDESLEIKRQARLNLNQKNLPKSSNEEKKTSILDSSRFKENSSNNNNNIAVSKEVAEIMEKFETNLRLSEILLANLGDKILELGIIAEKLEKVIPSNRKKTELDPHVEVFNGSFNESKKKKDKKSSSEVEITNPDGETVLFRKRTK